MCTGETTHIGQVWYETQFLISHTPNLYPLIDDIYGYHFVRITQQNL